MRGRKRVIENAKLTAFRIPVGLLKELKESAKKQNISFAKLVRNVLENFFAHNIDFEPVVVADKQEKLKYVSVFIAEDVLKQSRHFALDQNISLGEFLRNILEVYAAKNAKVE